MLKGSPRRRFSEGGGSDETSMEGSGAQGATEMSHQQWIEQRLLRPLLQMLVGPEKLRLCDTTDWSQVRDRVQQRDLVYPSYYHSQNFHGIEGGYLNPVAAITYDAVTRFASPPSEVKLRQLLVQAIAGQPRQILDLGCGTGSMTLMLKQRFPGAIVTGLDLSPYMLFLADYKAQQAGLDIRWQHGLAEATGLTTAAFDLITLSMLLHETPPPISQLILQECFRLLKPGGQIVILDGNQPRLRRANWLIQLFQEPYSKVYAAESVDQWMQVAKFEAVHTQAIGWIHQLTWGRKPQAAARGGAVARSQPTAGGSCPV